MSKQTIIMLILYNSMQWTKIYNVHRQLILVCSSCFTLLVETYPNVLFLLAVSRPFLREIKLVQTVEITGQIFCRFFGMCSKQSVLRA